MAEERVNGEPKPTPKVGAATPPVIEGGEDRALSALRRLARPQPKAFDAPAGPVPEMPLGAGSATGFVGTLAKRGPDDSRGVSDDSLAGGTGLHSGAEDSGMGLDDPRSGSKVGDSSGTVSGSAELIQMAREISLPRPASPIGHLEPVPAVPRRPAPRGRSRGLIVLMMVLGILLLAIGAWAVGALVYMQNVTPMSPREITYPFLVWNSDLQQTGAYARSSVVMAWSMLACVPVGILLESAGIIIWRRSRRG